jgi:hypothetical protein
MDDDFHALGLDRNVAVLDFLLQGHTQPPCVRARFFDFLEFAVECIERVAIRVDRELPHRVERRLLRLARAEFLGNDTGALRDGLDFDFRLHAERVFH